MSVAGRVQGWRPGGESEAVEDGAGGFGGMDGGEDAHATATVGTGEGIHREYATQEIGPRVAPRASGYGGSRS